MVLYCHAISWRFRLVPYVNDHRLEVPSSAISRNCYLTIRVTVYCFAALWILKYCCTISSILAQLVREGSRTTKRRVECKTLLGLKLRRLCSSTSIHIVVDQYTVRWIVKYKCPEILACELVYLSNREQLQTGFSSVFASIQ